MRALLAALLLAAAPACSAEPGEHDRALATEVRIGLLTPLTGPGEALGTEYRRGAELAVEVANAAEPDPLLGLGEAGAGGARIVLTVRDSAGSPTEAEQHADRLLKEFRPLAVVAADSDETIRAVSVLAERTRVPLVDAATVTGRLPDAGLDWYFRVPPGDRLLAEALLGALASDGREPRLSVVQPSGDRLGEAAAALADLAVEAGAQVVSGATFDGVRGAAAAAAAVVRAKPDVAVVLASTAAEASAMVRALRSKAPKMAIAGLGRGFSGPAFMAAAGSAANGVVRAETWSAEFAERNEVARRLAARYEARYQAPMSTAAANGFTAVLTVVGAVDATGARTPAAVRSALVAADVPGAALPMPWSGVRFARGGQNIAARGIVEQLRDGRARVVYPAELAGVQLRL